MPLHLRLKANQIIYLKNEGGNEKLEPEQEQRVKNRKTRGHIPTTSSEIVYDVSQKLTTYHLSEMIPSNFQEPFLFDWSIFFIQVGRNRTHPIFEKLYHTNICTSNLYQFTVLHSQIS